MKFLPLFLLFLLPACHFHADAELLMLRLESIKAQERLAANQLQALDKANALLDKANRPSGPIAEIESDESGRSHVRVYPQNENRYLMETIRELALNTHETVKSLHIDVPEEKASLAMPLIEKGHDLAKTGIMAWIARELLGIFVHGPNWQWAGDGMVD